MIAVLGAGGHGQVVASALRHLDLEYRFFDDADLNCPPFSAFVGDQFIVAVGDNKKRMEIYLDTAGTPVPIIHPLCHVSGDVPVEWGTFVGYGATVNIGASVGQNCIINTGAIVEHHAVIESHAHVAPGAIVLGGARIGQGALVGAGAVVLPGDVVPPWAVVRAGSVWKSK